MLTFLIYAVKKRHQHSEFNKTHLVRQCLRQQPFTFSFESIDIM